jgi:hypothetical protein
VRYYAEAGFYNDLVWFDMTGYQKMVTVEGYRHVEPDKNRRYSINWSYNTGSEWVPFLVSNDGGIEGIGVIADV